MPVCWLKRSFVWEMSVCLTLSVSSGTFSLFSSSCLFRSHCLYSSSPACYMFAWHAYKARVFSWKCVRVPSRRVACPTLISWSLAHSSQTCHASILSWCVGLLCAPVSHAPFVTAFLKAEGLLAWCEEVFCRHSLFSRLSFPALFFHFFSYAAARLFMLTFCVILILAGFCVTPCLSGSANVSNVPVKYILSMMCLMTCPACVTFICCDRHMSLILLSLSMGLVVSFLVLLVMSDWWYSQWEALCGCLPKSFLFSIIQCWENVGSVFRDFSLLDRL